MYVKVYCNSVYKDVIRDILTNRMWRIIRNIPGYKCISFITKICYTLDIEILPNLSVRRNDGTDIAGLMKILKSAQVESDERFPQVCSRIRQFKVEGRDSDMCSVVEEYAKEYAKEAVEEARKETAEELAVKMLQSGRFTVEEIADYIPGLGIDRIRELKAD